MEATACLGSRWFRAADAASERVSSAESFSVWLDWLEAAEDGAAVCASESGGDKEDILMASISEMG